MGDCQEKGYRREIEDESIRGHENNLSLNVTNNISSLMKTKYNCHLQKLFENPILISSNRSYLEIVVGFRLLRIHVSDTLTSCLNRNYIFNKAEPRLCIMRRPRSFARSAKALVNLLQCH